MALPSIEPPKGILRRPSGGLPPVKRRKVLFDEVRNTTHVVGGKSQDDIQQEVRRALETHLNNGPHGPYDGLKEMFSLERERQRTNASSQAESDESDEDDDPTPSQEAAKPEELRQYVVALINAVDLLKTKESNGLIKAVLGCPWLGRDKTFAATYTTFLTSLLAAQENWLSRVVEMLVDNFELGVQPSAWTVPGCPAVPREEMRDRLHTAIRLILRQLPAAANSLCATISDRFPFPGQATPVYLAYANNMLRIAEYAPYLEAYILDFIVLQLVKIDVQIQVDLDDEDDGLGSRVAGMLKDTHASEDRSGDSDDEDDADDSDNESLASNDSGYDAEVERVRTIKRNVEKLDALLNRLFTHLGPHFKDPDSDEALDYFRILINQFRTIILPTDKSRYVQFLLFHFGQKSEQLLDAFVGECASIAFQPGQSNIIRQAATTYMSNFVTRAALISSDLVRSIFITLLHKLDAYCRAHSPGCRGPNLKRYAPFYALFQGIMYIFCFRWKDFVIRAPSSVDPDDAATYVGQDLKWIPNFKEVLLASVHSKMNPLKVCHPDVVNQFAHIAHRLRFVYIWPRVQANTRVRLSQFLFDTYGIDGVLRDTGTSQLEERYHQLDNHSPFDPCTLPVSRKWIEREYVSWQPTPGLDVVESSEEEDDDDDEEEENGSVDGSEDGDDASDREFEDEMLASFAVLDQQLANGV